MRPDQHDIATMIERLEDVRREEGDQLPVYVATEAGIFAAYDITVEEWAGSPVVIMSLDKEPAVRYGGEVPAEGISRPDDSNDPRGAPQPETKAGPLVIEKHRHRRDGSEEVSFYACGPVRGSLGRAIEDAGNFERFLAADAWSYSRPIVAGWYWWQKNAETSPEVVQLLWDPEGEFWYWRGHARTTLFASHQDGTGSRWSGQISSPNSFAPWEGKS